MSLLIRDANTTIQSLSTGLDGGGNLVPVHIPAAVSGGVAAPISSTAPMPVINAAGAAALDGSGAVAVGGTAQTIFGGVVPISGYLIANNSSAILYVSDAGSATEGGASIPVAQGSVFVTPSGYRPAGPVSLYGGTTGQAFAARRW